MIAQKPRTSVNSRHSVRKKSASSRRLQKHARGKMADDRTCTKPHVDEQPVKVVGKSVVFDPARMELNKFYMAQPREDEVFLYRRVSEGEVEVYALAD